MESEVEGKTERITIRVTPTFRKRVVRTAKQLGVNEGEAIRMIFDDSTGFTDEEIAEAARRNQELLKMLQYQERISQSISDMLKDSRQEYGRLSAIAKTYSDGRKVALEAIKPDFNRER